MASFFRASRQLSKEKHTAEKFLMWRPHISASTTSPRRLPDSKIRFKGTRMRVSRVNQEKPKGNCRPPPPRPGLQPLNPGAGGNRASARWDNRAGRRRGARRKGAAGLRIFTGTAGECLVNSVMSSPGDSKQPSLPKHKHTGQLGQRREDQTREGRPPPAGPAPPSRHRRQLRRARAAAQRAPRASRVSKQKRWSGNRTEPPQ